MSMLTATELAGRLSLSKGRISQLVSDGRLDGCYEGEGRQRRFDLEKCKAALSGRLDPGQMLGNGAKTKEKLRDDPPSEKRGDLLEPRDPDRYELARTLKVEEEARRARRLNSEAEGTLVHADAVAMEVTRQIGQEIAQFEAVMRDAARAVADRMGVDYRTVRQILIETWRSHRSERADKLEKKAATAALSDAEKAADF
jgi:transcriptional regulator with XRE-family HTH domain